MSNTMEYKGYHAKPEYSDEDGLFIGKSLGIKDTIIFDGKSVEELREAFHESIDEYLEMCERYGKTPNKEYSGQFNLRVPPELHRELAIVADKRGDSLNSIVVEACSQYITT